MWAVKLYLLSISIQMFFFFFFQAEDGIRDDLVTGVQTCALPICRQAPGAARPPTPPGGPARPNTGRDQIGRASCRGRGEISVGAVSFKKKKNVDESEPPHPGKMLDDTAVRPHLDYT